MNGVNWSVMQQPAASAVSSTVVQIAFDSNFMYWFTKSGTTYTPYYSFLHISLVEDTTAQTLTFVDNTNGQTVTTVFNSMSATTNPGQFVSQTDARGVTTTVTSVTGTQINGLQRSYNISGSVTTESLLYSFYSSGTAANCLKSVTYQIQVGSASPTQISQASYTYYGSSDPNGSVNDLQLVSQQVPDGSGGWNTVAVDYYRYWLAGSSTGFAHGLKMHFGPEAYRLMWNDYAAGVITNPLTAADTVVKPYADQYFEYDPSTWQVTTEISAVCTSCVGGGTTLDQFAYSSNPLSPANGYNIWNTKTVQTLPDSSQIVVYTNYAAQAMLKVNIDTSSPPNMWGTFYRYDDTTGQVIWEAKPSAVMLPTSLSTLESNNDLLNFNSTSGTYQYLNNSSGLITVVTYDLDGNLLTHSVQQGQTGTPVLINSYTYTSHNDSNGNTITPMTASVSYPVAGSTTPSITTSYAYSYYGDGTSSPTNVLQQKTTTLPPISTAQNGPGTGTAIQTVEQYDTYGNLQQRTDERGIVSQYTYDPVMTRLTQQVLNYQSAGGSTTPGVNVTTNFGYDNQGRLILTLGSPHSVVISGAATTVTPASYVAYNPSFQPSSGTAWGVDQTFSGQGYATGTSPSYTYFVFNPVSVTNADKDGRVTDKITSVRSSGSGVLAPTDTYNQADWQTWTSTQYDDQHRTISSRVYFLIPSSGTGSVGTNYGQTEYGYDALERQNRMNAPGGTITRSVWVCPQLVASVWVGTNDTGATDTNPSNNGTAPNNMVQVSLNIYDNGTTSNPSGSGGDGNLVQQIQYVSGTGGDTRITHYGYDFRDRRSSMTDAISRYTTYSLDNFSRITEVDSYNVSGGTLITKNTTSYDDQNRVFQTSNYAVNISTGAYGNALTSNTWYDLSGNVIQQIQQGDGQVFTKTTYNGVNWITGTYRGYNTNGTSYSQAVAVVDSNDVIVTQSIPTYDAAGNMISQANFDRINNDTTAGLPLSANGISPAARVMYTANWFDGIDRLIASANYGVQAIAPSFPTAPPASSSAVLVSGTSYDSDGRAYQMVDPNGRIKQTSYDAAGRVTQTIEDVGTGTLNRTTYWTYTLDNLIATLTAVNSTTGDQTTTYTYGTSASSSYVVRNDLLASVTYPDSVSGSDVVTYAYNRQGEQRTVTDQRGTVHTFYFDKLGRQTNDCVTTVGTGVDTAVRQIQTTYEIRGMPQIIISRNSATVNSGTLVNEVQLTYNTFGQLNRELQEHHAGMIGSIPNVYYSYDSGSANQVRPVTLTYPNGRVITFNYGTSGGMNDYLNRIETIQDTTSGTFNLSSYAYLGSGAAVRITYPQPGVWLDLWGGTTGTFAGMDQFNRIIDQRWQNNITSTPTDIDRYSYSYDQNSNRLTKGNTTAHAASIYLDEAYTYDNLDRLTQMQRGNLSSGVITGTPARQMNYTLDSTGNWPNYQTSTGGTVDLNQTRTSNTVNEITAIGGTPAWSTPPVYDKAGNMTSFPQPATPTSAFTATYDAWNRLVSLNNSSGNVATYQYDGMGRRIVKVTSGTGGQTRHFYYTNNWQDIEEQVGTTSTPTTDVQYVWGVRYVDELVCRDDATPQRLYAMQDANFNLTGVTDTSGTVQERYLFDPYGNRTIMNASWGAIAASAYSWVIGHQGLMQDGESRLVYNRARYLHCQLGIFLSRDNLAYRDGMNLAEYTNTNPTNRTDPSGLISYLAATCILWQQRGNICVYQCRCPKGFTLGAMSSYNSQPCSKNPPSPLCFSYTAWDILWGIALVGVVVVVIIQPELGPVLVAGGKLAVD